MSPNRLVPLILFPPHSPSHHHPVLSSLRSQEYEEGWGEVFLSSHHYLTLPLALLSQFRPLSSHPISHPIYTTIPSQLLPTPPLALVPNQPILLCHLHISTHPSHIPFLTSLHSFVYSSCPLDILSQKHSLLSLFITPTPSFALSIRCFSSHPQQLTIIFNLSAHATHRSRT